MWCVIYRNKIFGPFESDYVANKLCYQISQATNGDFVFAKEMIIPYYDSKYQVFNLSGIID